jgi:hypothetical protein
MDPRDYMSPTSLPEDGTDPVSETLCGLEYRKMNKVKRPSNPEDNI